MAQPDAMRVLVIADDLTGAIEAGAKFAAAGLPSIVTVQRTSSAEVTVIDTESRHLAPGAAASRVRDACRGVAPLLVYKKTDSTLRGNIASELSAMSEAFPGPIAYIGAYPAVGRTVRTGSVFVHGVPVAETEFAHDALNPIRDSRISSVTGSAVCEIFDGETQDDVDAAVARALQSFRVIAGPASVAESLARVIGAPHPITWPVVRSCLVVNGSRTTVSREQTSYAVRSGTIDDHWRLLDLEIPDGLEAGEAAHRRAEAVRDQLGAYDALVVFGGDSAFAILKCMGLPDLRPIGEILPGVPVSRIAGRPEVLITKAGGYGAPDLVERLRIELDGIR